MTLKTTITGHAATVFLNTDHFADTVTLNPLGVTGNAVSVKAIWTPDEPDRDKPKHGDDTQTDEGVLSVGTVDTAGDAISPDESDTWEIDSVVYQVDGVGPLQDGLRDIQLTAVTKRHTGVDNSIGLL